MLAGGRVDRDGLAGGAVWVSDDGRAFTLVDDDPALSSDRSSRVGLSGVTWDATRFVVAGTVVRGAASWPFAAASADGPRWRRLGGDAPPPAGRVLAVVPGPALYGVAAGGRPACWSPQPDRWVSCPAPPASAPAPEHIAACADGAVRVLLLRYQGSMSVWCSRGARWRPLHVPPAARRTPAPPALACSADTILLASGGSVWTRPAQTGT